jgi:HSP20 family protein
MKPWGALLRCLFCPTLQKESNMNLIRRNPSAMSSYRPRLLEEQLGRLFNEFAADLPGSALGIGSELTSPRLNVNETEQSFEVQAELPGVNKDDVKVSIDHQRVTIEAQSQSQDQLREGENRIHTERSARKFMRSFVLPAEVDDSAAQARMENGILMLSLPKKQGSTATTLTIQ